MKVLYGRKYDKSIDVKVTEATTIGDLRKQLAPIVKLSWTRIELRGPPTENRKDVAKYTGDLNKLLPKYNLDASKNELYVKDLGAQFSYRGVFLIEYGGPIAIILAFLLRPAFLFGAQGPLRFWEALTLKNAHAPEGSAEWSSFVQALAIAMWLAHFLKRELETLFVHKFSRPTMPLSNLFKNSTYYWGFAAFVGFPLVNALYSAPGKTQVAVGVAGWVVAQLCNLAVHIQLANMRPTEGSDKRDVPGGPLFALVSCPNYTAEVAGWLAWSIASSIGMGYAFTLVGFLQMWQWAAAKHRGYVKQYRAEKKTLRRTAIVPFLL